jgi:NADH dehydrogenase
MILVTGATGYIGGHILDRLAAAAIPTRALVRQASATLPGGVESAVGDVTKPDTLDAALVGVDTIIHAAAITADNKEPYRGAYSAVNQGGTENLVRAAKAAGVKRIVLLSGLGTKPDKPSTYMATRWAMEEAVRASGIAYVIIQPSVLFGAGAPFIVALANLAKLTPVVPAIGGNLRFQPIWVEDVVTCVVQAAERDDVLGRAITIGGAEQVTFKEVIQAIGRAMGKRRTTAPLPMPIARVQASLFNLLPKPPLTPASLELFTFDNVTALDSVERNFGFKPQAFRAYLEEHGLS